MKKILIFVDPNQPKLAFELQAISELIRKKEPVHVTAIMLNIQTDLYLEQLSKSFDQLIVIEKEYSTIYAMNEIANDFKKIVQKNNYDYFLISATAYGRNLAPFVSAKLDVGLTADVTKLAYEEGELLMTRPTFGAKLLATISCDTKPTMLSIRPNVLVVESDERSENNKVKCTQIEYINFNEEINEKKVKLIASELKESIAIEEATVLISGGAGLGGDFSKLFEFTKFVNAEVACSKNPVDNNFQPRARQVGLSGKIVAPKIYIACGISGATHHLFGMNKSAKIISINPNKYTAMNMIADVVILNDAQVVIERLNQKLCSKKFTK